MSQMLTTFCKIPLWEPQVLHLCQMCSRVLLRLITTWIFKWALRACRYYFQEKIETIKPTAQVIEHANIFFLTVASLSVRCFIILGNWNYSRSKTVHGPNSWQKYSTLGPKSALFDSSKNQSNDNSLSLCNLVPACELLDRRFSYMVRETCLKIMGQFSFWFKLYRRSTHLLEHPYHFYPNFSCNSARIAPNIYRSEKCFKQTLQWKITRMFYVHFVFLVGRVGFEVIKRKKIVMESLDWS